MANCSHLNTELYGWFYSDDWRAVFQCNHCGILGRATFSVNWNPIYVFWGTEKVTPSIKDDYLELFGEYHNANKDN